MKETLEQLNILLVQIREKEEAIQQEFEAFTRDFCIQPKQITLFNAIRDSISTLSLSTFDAVIFGGAGAFSAKFDHPFYPKLNFILNYVRAHRIPFLGVCWGHQYLARYAGAKVLREEAQFEYGSIKVTLTEDGCKDALFSQLPKEFSAYAGHEDSAENLPDHLIPLGHSKRSTNQIIRWDGYPMYGVQFHPELTFLTIRQRLLIYKAHLPFPNSESFNATYHSILDSNEAKSLLPAFLNTFCISS